MLVPGPFQCAACGAAPVHARGAGRLNFALCDACGHAAVAAEDLARAAATYNHAYDGFRVDASFSAFTRAFLRDELIPLVGARASVLDVGCGNGEFLVAAREAGLRTSGWDPSPAAVELARARGLDVAGGELDHAVPAGGFDLVTMWDVIEHVPAPSVLLRSAARALHEGGYLLVKTPGISRSAVELCARIPRLSGSVLSVPAHIQFFSEKSLATVLEREGFTVERHIEVAGLRTPTRGGGFAKEMRRRVAREIPRALGCRGLLVLARRRSR